MSTDPNSTPRGVLVFEDEENLEIALLHYMLVLADANNPATSDLLQSYVNTARRFLSESRYEQLGFGQFEVALVALKASEDTGVDYSEERLRLSHPDLHQAMLDEQARLETWRQNRQTAK